MARGMATTTGKPKTAVLMMNMGGPATPAETGPFLKRLFTDGDIIPLGPLQNILGNYIAKRECLVVPCRVVLRIPEPALLWFGPSL
jgi:hypothetical protein